MAQRCTAVVGIALSAALLVTSTEPAESEDKVVSISTLDWQPYTGSELPKGGATTDVVRTVFAKSGYKIDVAYQPWKRAIDTAERSIAGVIAYFPGYHCNHRPGFVASEPIGNGPLGFAQHADVPMVWKDLDDIGKQKLKIGTVLGYANTDEFDAKVKNGSIQTNTANDDVTNLKKLLRKRIDAVVIDKLVFEYLKVTDEGLKRSADKLQFNRKPLEDKTLYLCFRDDEQGRTLKQIFNAGLKQIDTEAIMNGYFATEFD
jgi:polar amino acid transport system substrate-binding protein